MLMRCVTSTFDCRTWTPKQSSQACVGNSEDNARIPGCCPMLGREHYAQVWEAGGFSRGVASPCHFFHEGLQTYILLQGDDFFIVGRREGQKVCTEFAARCRGVQQNCNSVHRVVQVTDSEFLGQDTDIATVVNRVRA